MRANYKGFNLTIREEYATDLPLQRIVPQDFSRAVLNLMNNACYAVYNKSKCSAVGFEPVISVTLRREEDQVCLQIEDNGTGMPAAIKEQIFIPFYTTKPAGEGTGLGLSITRPIIEEKHKGTIQVDSEEGKFTRFTIRIPLTK